MNPVLEITRPLACLGAAAVSVLGSHLGGSLDPGGSVLAAAVAVLLIVAACNIVNDVVDLSVDRAHRPGRPLPSGRLDIQTALPAAVICAVGGLAVTIVIGPAAVLVAAGFLVAGFAYSLLVRRVTLLGHLWVATMFGATALWGGWISGATSSSVWTAAVLVALFLLPRELLKSLGDRRGDAAAGWRTASVSWGPVVTLRAMAVSVAVFAAATVMPVLGGIGGAAYLAGIWVGAVLPLAAVTAWLWPDVDHRLRRGELLTSLMWFPGLAALWLLG